MSNILIAGCGELGNLLGHKLSQAGHKVWGLRRNAQAVRVPIQPIQADLLAIESLQQLPKHLDYVFYMPAADGFNDQAYCDCYVRGLNNILQALQEQNQNLKRFFFISSTCVYSQNEGEWVDEETATPPKHFTGIRHLEAENLALSSAYPATVVRFAGIYGPSRARFLKEVLSGRAKMHENPVYSNRIHIEDCTGVLEHLMSLKDPQELYLAVDSAPTLENEILSWLADQLFLPEPEYADSISERLRSNKRCKNQRLIDSGYQFLYPTYKEGLENVIAQMEEDEE